MITRRIVDQRFDPQIARIRALAVLIELSHIQVKYEQMDRSQILICGTSLRDITSVANELKKRLKANFEFEKLEATIAPPELQKADELIRLKEKETGNPIALIGLYSQESKTFLIKIKCDDEINLKKLLPYVEKTLGRKLDNIEERIPAQ